MQIVRNIIAGQFRSKLKVNFYFRNSHVYTVDEHTFDKLWSSRMNPAIDETGEMELEVGEDYSYLIIESSIEQEEFDALSEAAAKIRPEVLVIHGILCFLTAKPILPFEFNSSRTTVSKSHIVRPKKMHCVLLFEKSDYSRDLRRLLKTLDSKSAKSQELVFSLLDRWRKALFLENESEESLLYEDESILAYFHIWELLAEEFEDGLKAGISQKFRRTISEVFEKDLHAGKKEKQEELQLLRLIETATIGKLSVKQKIFHMFKHLGMYNNKSHAIVERYLKYRNAIAHGTGLYQSKTIFPLKPFFSLIKDVDPHIQCIRVATARTIAAYLKLDIWKTDWELILELEPSPLELVRDFIKQQKYLGLAPEEYFAGRIDEITPYTLANCYIDGLIPFQALEKALRDLILQITLSTANMDYLVHALVILGDSKDSQLAAKAQQLSRQLLLDSWIDVSDLSDLYQRLQYMHLNPRWIKQLLN